ncbi:sulfurtransferase [Ornithinimicrobium sp. Y1694]|uniref:sulfurtransferase n=1 Tax=Ornithinimicrobium sp. Y1694 TaxID=3418590 RepID=UPI003CEBBDDC
MSATELAQELEGDAPPMLVDVRWALGAGAAANHAAYRDGHLPGASFLDLETALSDPPRHGGVGGRHPMPTPERVEDGLRAAGVREGQPVVFYDSRTSLGAARAWWVATYYGVPARVLDGGLAAWEAAGLPVESGDVQPIEGDVSLVAGSKDLLQAPGVIGFLAGGGQLLDSRPAQRFRGENEVIDPVAGHIPGARSLPALSLLDDEGGFLDGNAIRALLRDAGAEPGAPTAVYCGSGVQAAHAALALEAAGLESPAVYVGSWSDWITDPARPVATGGADD